MITCVPDASVLLKWVLQGPDEPDQDAALRLRDRFLADEIRLCLPSLWLFEVGNVLTLRLPEAAQDLLDLLVEMGMEEPEPADSWRHRAIELTRRFGVTFYDASYHALAIELGGVFVTADTRYLERTRKAGSATLLRDLI